MIAQTVVEYGALQSISASLSNVVYQIERYIGMGNSKYLLILVIAGIVLLFWTRRR